MTIVFIKCRKKRYAHLEGWGGTYNNEKVAINNANTIKRKFIITDNDNVSLWQTAAIWHKPFTHRLLPTVVETLSQYDHSLWLANRVTICRHYFIPGLLCCCGALKWALLGWLINVWLHIRDEALRFNIISSLPDKEGSRVTVKKCTKGYCNIEWGNLVKTADKIKDLSPRRILMHPWVWCPAFTSRQFVVS